MSITIIGAHLHRFSMKQMNLVSFPMRYGKTIVESIPRVFVRKFISLPFLSMSENFIKELIAKDDYRYREGAPIRQESENFDKLFNS